MRLSSSRLRQIIKEEISRINESNYRLRPQRLTPGKGDDIDTGPYNPYADPNIDLGGPGEDPAAAIRAEEEAQRRSYDNMSGYLRSSGNAITTAYKSMNPKPMSGRRIFILDLGTAEEMSDEHLFAYTAQTAGVGRGDIMVKKMPGNYIKQYFRFMETGRIPDNVYFFSPERGIFKP